jgi:hypothetical protein
VRRLLNSCGEGCAYGGSPFQGWCPASEVNDGVCPEKPDHLRVAREWVAENWPGSATVLAVRCKGSRDGKPLHETRYYVISLHTSGRALLQHVRDRWSIENSWHWPRDTQLREDAHRYCDVYGVQIIATPQAWPRMRCSSMDSERSPRGWAP